MRKAQEDVLARTEAERVMRDLLETEKAADPEGSAKTVIGSFKTVEFETGTSKDPDRNTVPMRRLVITGPWVVDPNGVAHTR